MSEGIVNSGGGGSSWRSDAPVARTQGVVTSEHFVARGRATSHGSPLQGSGAFVGSNPGLHPGLVYFAPLGLKISGDSDPLSIILHLPSLPFRVIRTWDTVVETPTIEARGRATTCHV